ncbi:hypothetical protein AHAS_Ahas10G0063600 [Arachis hypogaea]
MPPLNHFIIREDLPSSLNPRIKIIRGTRAPVHALVVKVAIAMASGLHPKSLPNGLCSAYLFFNPNSLCKAPSRLQFASARLLSVNLLYISLITAPSLLYLQQPSSNSFTLFSSPTMRLNSSRRFIVHAFDVDELGPSLYSVFSWLDNPYFKWLHWSQASTPFSNSEFDYISKLDQFNNAQILRSKLFLLTTKNLSDTVRFISEFTKKIHW